MTRYQIIWKTIKRVPCGRVATYGQIAKLAGMEGHARLVGYALHRVKPAAGVPWHRIINSSGRISLIGPSARRQRVLLEREGVRFNAAGRIDLKQFQWKQK